MKLIVLALAAGTAVAECPNVRKQRCNKGRTEKSCRPGAPRKRQPPPSQRGHGHPRSHGNTQTRRERTPVRADRPRRAPGRTNP